MSWCGEGILTVVSSVMVLLAKNFVLSVLYGRGEMGCYEL